MPLLLVGLGWYLEEFARLEVIGPASSVGIPGMNKADAKLFVCHGGTNAPHCATVHMARFGKVESPSW